MSEAKKQDRTVRPRTRGCPPLDVVLDAKAVFVRHPLGMLLEIAEMSSENSEQFEETCLTKL